MKTIATFALLGLAATPLVDAASAVPGLRVEMRYAGRHNLIGQPISRDARCWLVPEAVAALRRAEETVSRQGFALLVWDCYRTRSAQERLWAKQPTPGLVANPKYGSNHNRGVAVDVTLVRADGSPTEMPTDFDDFTSRAARDATAGIPAAALAHRAILMRAMIAAGFTTIRREWWHFDLSGARGYPLLGDTIR